MCKPSFFYSWRDFGFGFELITPVKVTSFEHKSALNVMFGPLRFVFWLGKRKEIGHATDQ
jgi:hypothetical protein